MSSKYPLAEAVSPVNQRSAVACKHCARPIAVGTWDKFNGFLTECPCCHAYHGRAWNVRGIALASFLLNMLSFFFTMRPGRALAAIAGWAVVFWFVLPRSQSWPDSAQVVVYGALLLGPMIVNSILLVRHQIDLDRHPIPSGAR